ERDQSATTLQMLELVNGETLTRMLHNGARRMLGQMPAAPENLYDSGPLSDHVVPVDVDITGVKELHLVVSDNGSYSPERVLPVWAAAKLTGPGGEVPLASLKPITATKAVTDGGPVQMKGAAFDSGIRTALTSEIVYNIAGRGFTRLQASAGLEQACLQSDISPSVRFFVFNTKPDFERLVKVAPELPVSAPTGALSRDQMIDRVFTFSLGRAPTERERTLASAYLADPAHAGAISPNGLADLIWSVAMLPEFQLIL
ncbi:MAG TPA: hypothetical protein DEQ47_12325, partial [Solibacterales bacterium]|nr:hypothetical protein [Bryobacterales bacterium]